MEPLVRLRVPAKWICLSIILVLLYAIPSSSTDASLDVSVDGMFKGVILDQPLEYCRHVKYCKLKRCRDTPLCKDIEKYKKNPKKVNKKVEYCVTDRCVKTAKLIKANMDTQIKPCDDFYSFACNGFAANNRQKEGINSKDIDYQLKVDIAGWILAILRRRYGKNSNSKALAEARTKFDKCVKEKMSQSRLGYKTKEQWALQICGSQAMRNNDIWPLAREFVKNFGMTNTEKIYHEQMIENIRQSFLDDLSAISWLDNNTKNHAMTKAKAVKYVLSHKPELFQFDEVPPEKLKGNKITVDALLELPTSVNAEYYTWLNSMFVSRAMMNYPFSNMGLPVLDYAAMGTVLAHEFTHGFDDEGRTYDESGDDKDWWSDVAVKEFEKRVACFKKQYGQFYITTKKGGKLHLNSVETFDEDIADNGGVSLSYRAYKRLNAKKEKLKDLEEYTDEQLFFIGYANSFCRSETVEFTEHTIKADEHSPPKYRVNVPLSNMKEFADAFQCREGSNMNPRREKCKIW